mmetsp:Transcript_6876/g.13833  ORF Transcript_6876/g.13833 Transcript_6876/m.13833 type:complete len:182 (-) Transcript_6876:207-752(-)|eukprot:CAMPEP_0202835120 /NCGR_PEP_ID=MMETSP1389-20130828/35275_1 /ASSEMBLY_ACC=CAM_ASM_000865 /TAXON_ID=302021 /ORGANISM="Rhodomonas sp., Strain CCMP768" /LENGTH=181 /DNA_ID=CAMNT_0049510523 /DNA_START=73 /DNA_END=618 /DNA_ORIENTATION=+
MRRAFGVQPSNLISFKGGPCPCCTAKKKVPIASFTCEQCGNSVQVVGNRSSLQAHVFETTRHNPELKKVTKAVLDAQAAAFSYQFAWRLAGQSSSDVAFSSSITHKNPAALAPMQDIQPTHWRFPISCSDSLHFEVCDYEQPLPELPELDRRREPDFATDDFPLLESSITDEAFDPYGYQT